MLKSLFRLCRAALLLACVLFGLAAVALCQRHTVLVILVLGGLFWKRGRRWADRSSHGTARLADMAELMQNDMTGDGGGLIVGRAGFAVLPTRVQGGLALIDPRIGSDAACRIFLSSFYRRRWTTERLLRINRFTHLSTFAPTGRGKSVSVLFPNLLSYDRSCVVIDPAGELHATTAEHRRKAFMHRIIRIDPYQICGPGGDCYNPLEAMRPDAPDLIEQVRDLANQLVVRSGTEPDPHWPDKAESVIASFLYFIVTCETNPFDRHLLTLREMLSSHALFERTAKIMRKHFDHSLLIRLGSQMGWLRDRELASVMSTVQRHVEWMDAPLVADCLTLSSFDPTVLRTDRVTLYLTVPNDKMTVLAAYNRTIIGSLLRVLSRHGADESIPLLFLIDEAASLGQIKTLENAVTTARKTGIRLWFFWQSPDQMKDCFGSRANIILGNMDTTQWFGVNDYDTAENLSKRIGDETRAVGSETKGTSSSRPTGASGREPQSGNQTTSDSFTTNAIARRLFKPEEILTFPEDTGLVFHRSLPAILVRLVRHYADWEFQGGRSGRQPGLGVAAVAMVAVTLLLGILAASFTGSLPDFGVERLNRGVAAPIWPSPTGDTKPLPVRPPVDPLLNDPFSNIRLPIPTLPPRRTR